MTSCDENDVTWGDRVHYRELGPGGRAQGVTVTLTRSLMGGKTGPGVDPAGWQSNKGYNRTHLLGAQIGGSNKDPRNFVTMHAYANSPMVRRRIQGRQRHPRERLAGGTGLRRFQFMPQVETTGTNRIYLPNDPRN
ncbi:DNA/RNA non-specific endonuclease [Streptomyces sp. NPDC057539]|uniref:DNA/RNA non-specific endonuclease n=1 Tax=Streptomyces sp. NPDC057539 TaxID=3346159 RepID=UPI0036C03170